MSEQQSEREAITVDSIRAAGGIVYCDGEIKFTSIEQLRAALSKPSTEQGWRTIESAPRDGTMFLCWVRAERYGETDEGQQYQHDESQVDFCWWRTLAESPDGGYFDPACGQIGDRQFVSHWMPLPTPPIEPR